MADKKEIIIDGVDISECEHLTEIEGCWLSTCDYLKYKGNLTNKLCKYNHNCYYKQLARKEQECEELKKANDDKNKLLSKLGCPTTATAKRQEFVLQQQIDQLKEELKEQTCGLRPELKRLIDKICRKYDIEAKTYHEKIVEIIHCLDDYNQALIDIEEILKQGIKIS